MAFSNVKNVPLGGGLNIICGNFTSTVGAAAQTYKVGAGRILLVQVNPQATGEPVDFDPSFYSVSISAGINTLTIYTQAGISAGTFLLIVDSGA